MCKKLILLTFFIVVLGLAMSVPAGAEQFLVEHFNYANGTDLNGQVVGKGAWETDGTNYMVLNDDGSGDGGTSSLQYPGLTDSQGGRLTPAGDCSYMLTTPVVGEGNFVYLSVLLKPTAILSGYFIHFETTGSIQHQLGRLRGWNSGGEQELGVSIRGSGPAGRSDKTVALGETALVVFKLTMVPGADNDIVEIWVNPTVGTPEPPADAASSPDPGNDLNPATGIRGFVFRDSGAGESKEVDEIRFGTTWDDVVGSVAGKEAASAPSPGDEMTDVLRNTVLSWTPGEYAAPINGHKVYFSENFDDVNDATGGDAQSAASYAPPRLDFGTTYYWRVDEVDGAPDFAVHQGDVWSFTTEPIGYPIANVIATASSSDVGKGPENTVNGAGLDDSGLLHGKEGDSMWLSSMMGPQPTWIEYEFDNVYKLHEMWVWNSNESLEPMIGLGFKDVSIDYSVNGTDYTTLGTTHEFAQAPGLDDYAHNTTVDLNGVAAKYVRLTANSNWGGILDQYGLSEIRFFYIPILAREPDPDSGARDVSIGTIDEPIDVTLGFRAGREAARHDVYLSSDEQAVIDGTAPAVTVTETSYGPLSLDLGTTYYWRVDEVNDAETPTTWQGGLWDFRTQEYFVVDDFEDYNDYPPDEIFSTWIDGYGTTTNGSTAGYAEPDFLAGEHFVETTIVHGGDQSMPFFYSNTGGSTHSEGKRTFAVLQDWAKAGVQTLTLWFYGTAGNTGQMYVNINGSKIPYDGAAGNIALAGWQVWNIDLASSGLNLQSVSSLAIGIDGSGASGTLYFDDIRLYSYSRQFITPAEPNNAGLVAHYKLDQDATDNSGNNNHGTLVGDPQWVVGKIGGALEFDGSGDWLDCGSDPILAIGEAVSISTWIKIGALGIGHKVGGNQDGVNGGYKMGVQSDKIEFEIRTSGNAAVLNRNVAGGIILEVDVWYHVTGVYSLADGYIRTYVNGVLDRELITTEVLGASPGTLYIGCEPYDTGSNNFNGVLDDVRIYNCALSLGEVAWLAGRTKPFDKPF